MNLLSHEKLDVVFSSKDAEMANYKLEIEITPAYSKAKRKETLKSMKQFASFSGFRKGTLPPFITKDIPGFVLRDSCSQLIESAINELDLTPVEGEAAEPRMDERGMIKEFVVGEHFVFTCEIQLQKTFDDQEEEDVEDIVKVEEEPEKVEVFKEKS